MNDRNQGRRRGFLRTLSFLAGVLPLLGALMTIEHRQASAYLDGGTTSVLIQMIAGGSLFR